MQDYRAETYGERVAGIYDEWSGALTETEASVDFLAKLADRANALELGVGTGRVALPLARRGVPMWGVEISEDMVRRMAQQPDGDLVRCTIGDMADVDVAERFGLVFAVYNTFFGILTQDDQVRCFRNVAAHLDPGGSFVVEVYVPDPGRYDRDGGRVALGYLTGAEVGIETGKVDPTRQRVDTQLLALSESGGVRSYPAELRYAWPSELDLMARLAGLHLVERWGGWDRAPYTARSERHVSVYRKPEL